MSRPHLLSPSPVSCTYFVIQRTDGRRKSRERWREIHKGSFSLYQIKLSKTQFKYTKRMKYLLFFGMLFGVLSVMSTASSLFERNGKCCRPNASGYCRGTNQAVGFDLIWLDGSASDCCGVGNSGPQKTKWLLGCDEGCCYCQSCLSKLSNEISWRNYNGNR